MWYQGQKHISDTIKEFREDIKETLTRIENQTTKTNGRVGSLESSRTQIWTAIIVFIFLGGVIITLAIMAIDSKIKDGVEKITKEIKI